MSHSLSYFEDEVREGFFIPGMVKRSWATQMDVLLKVREICERHEINWFADYGTLIGCVRHGGFIPWDDDLDICMLRDDFERFLEYAKDELPEDYKILSVDSEVEYNNFLARITNTSSINFSQSFLSDNNGFPYVAGIDIFPLDYLYNDEEREEERRLRAKELLEYAESVSDRSDIPAKQIYKAAEKIAGFELEKDIPIKAAFVRAITKIHKECPKDGAEYVANLYFWAKFKAQKYPLDFFKSVAVMPFEDGEINVTPAYSEKLRIAYGSWERVNRNGGVHNYPFYIDQEAILKEHYGGQLPYKYTFNPDDLVRPATKTNKDTCLEYLNTIKTANLLLVTLLKMGKNEDTLEILNQCQTMAIKVGGIIDFCNGEGTTEVAFLEDYCENIYSIYEAVTEATNLGQTLEVTDELAVGLNELIEAVRTRIEGDSLKPVITFMPFKHEYWNRFERLYEDFSSNPEYTCYVMPLSYRYKQLGKVFEEEIFDFEEYSGELPLLNYKEMDLNDFHSDIIVIQNPYDQWNSAVTLDSFFYSSNLVNRCENLIYIPYFKMGKIDPAEKKAAANARWYMLTSGVMHADFIYLDDEDVRQNYIEILTEDLGEESRSFWEDKILVGEFLSKKEETPKEERKTLLFYFGLSDIYLKKEAALDKLERVIDTFEESAGELKILWKADPNILENIRRTVPELEKRYIELVRRYESLGVGTYDETGNIPELMDRCTAFYGSKGYYMNLAVLKKKPVMVMNCDI